MASVTHLRPPQDTTEATDAAIFQVPLALWGEGYLIVWFLQGHNAYPVVAGARADGPPLLLSDDHSAGDTAAADGVRCLYSTFEVVLTGACRFAACACCGPSVGRRRGRARCCFVCTPRCARVILLAMPTVHPCLSEPPILDTSNTVVISFGSSVGACCFCSSFPRPIDCACVQVSLCSRAALCTFSTPFSLIASA